MCTTGVSPDAFLKQSKLEQAMDILVEVFQNYADKTCGNKKTLSYTELKALVQKELNHHVERSWDPFQMTRLMTCLDTNNDGTLCFEEMMFLITRVIIHSHPFFKDYKPTILVCGQLNYC